MARAFLDAFKGYFKNMLRCDLAHGAKPLQRIFAHPGGNFTKFGIAQPRIGFGEGHEVTARVDRAIARILGTHPGRDVIAVAHMGVLLTQLQQALGVSAYDAFGHRIDNLSVTELHRAGTGWQAAAINHRP